MCTQIDIDGDKEGVKTSPINGYFGSVYCVFPSIYVHIYYIFTHIDIHFACILIFLYAENVAHLL